MTPVQFGWSMPSGLSEKEHPGRYFDVLRKGLEMVKGTYDSAWFVDHLQFDDREVMEGWTAITYLAAQQPDLAQPRRGFWADVAQLFLFGAHARPSAISAAPGLDA